MNVGVISGALAIGGMEVGACRLARTLADLGYAVWIAYHGLERLDAHPIGAFLSQDGVAERFRPWSAVHRALVDTDVLWVSQGGFLDGNGIVAAMNAVPWRFEYQGQPANVVPPTQDFVPTWFVDKTRHLSHDMRARRQMDVAGHMVIPGIPVMVPEKVDRAPTDPPLFFTMCRQVDWQKRLSVVIEAAHMLARAGYRLRLVLAGDGPDRPTYQQMAGDAPYIEFPGWVTGEVRDALIREAFCYVMPSLWEGSSRSLREMMALGVPVICGRGGGTPELVRDGVDALLLDVSGNHQANRTREAQACTELMAHLLDNPSLGDALAAHARERIVTLNTRATAQIARWMAAIRDGRLLPVGAVDVSVIIPAWNAAKTLRATLDSVLRQVGNDEYPLPNYEIIVVDDGSTDDTYAIARTYADEDRRIVVIRQTNRGVNAARNRAALAARGEALLPLDADDELLGELHDDGSVRVYNWLAKAWAVYRECGGECLVYGRTIRYVPTNWKGGVPYRNDAGEEIAKVIRPRTFVEDFKLLMGVRHDASRTLLPTALHPRRAWACVGGWGWEGGVAGGVGRGLEDSAYNIEVILCGYQLRYVPDIYYHWRFRPDSRSSKMDFRREWAALRDHYRPRLQEAGYGV